MLTQIMTLLVPTQLIALVLVSRTRANTQATALRSAVTAALGLQFLLATVSFGFLLLGSPTPSAPPEEATSAGVGETLSHYDGVSGIMFLLVSFVGLVVCKFSIRYLDGEQEQGNYSRWLGFTLGAVSLLVVSGNLVLLFIAWVMTSFGLHHLLLHFKERPWAQRAAWTKFAISRIGDVFLLTAMILVYLEFGSLRLADILTLANEITEPSWQLSIVGWCLMLGAVTKSAQFPFHFWLPETMEAPTPVSALMHAGIVNAGGYLLVRLSPLVTHAPAAMTVLAIIGGFTAVFAALVMMTQASVKRSLGYSTVAQMGFMMLQCGLGAFSAAMLHIVAHSLYKAHAFLRTGDAWRVERSEPSASTATKSQSKQAPKFLIKQLQLGFAVVIAAVIITFVASGLAFDLNAKAGGLTLVAIICLAVASWLVQASGTPWRVLGNTALTSVVLVTAYMLSFFVVDQLIRDHIPTVTNGTMAASVGVLLVGLFAILQPLLPLAARARWLQVFYVHISNGFYVDTMVRRTLGLSLSRTPSAS